MSMSEEQRKLRRWFQRHGWHTCDTPTGSGVYLETPIENCAGLSYREKDSVTGETRQFSWERFAGIEVDRFSCDYVTISIHQRRHWWKRDPSIPDGEHQGYSWIPSDDFEDWKRQPDATINIPARDIIKLAELIQATQKDWCKIRKRKYSPTIFTNFKNSLVRWIGVNSSYEEIKWAYSNERLRQERGGHLSISRRST